VHSILTTTNLQQGGCFYESYCAKSQQQKIHNVIMLAWPSHILISNNPVLVIGKQTTITVSNDFKVSLLPDITLLMLPFKLFEVCFRRPEASRMWTPHLTIIV